MTTIEQEEVCDCCELSEYQPPADDQYGPCENCGDSPEEHQR